MRTYLLSMPIMPVTVGICYDTLPLHCTLVQYFKTEEPRDSLCRELRLLCETFAAPRLTRRKEARFGANHDIPVFLVNTQHAHYKLHWNVLDLLKVLRAHILEPAWAGDGYRPHVTIQGAHPFLHGETTTVDHAVLVEKMVDGRKMVHARFPFRQ